jgi:hypothetical protein
MDEISKVKGAYRACIDLPDDVTDAELTAEAVQMLTYARHDVTLDSLKLDIAQGLANRIRVGSLNDANCGALAQAILELANAHRT